MAPGLPRVRYHELVLLALVAVTVLTLGWIIARDFRQSAEDASQLYGRLAEGLELIEELQFNTQEVRRILLYALHTSDANRQLQYAEQSRAADAHVQQLLEHPGTLGAQTRPGLALQTVKSDGVGTCWCETRSSASSSRAAWPRAWRATNSRARPRSTTFARPSRVCGPARGRGRSPGPAGQDPARTAPRCVSRCWWPAPCSRRRSASTW